MKLISLFSGIGGFELAAEWMGWTPIVSCEINPFGKKVLEHYWPKAYHHDDIKTLTYEKINEELTQKFGAEWRSDDIILTGGFPCQPYSMAGKRLGKEDERHLWPEMLRIIREVQPTWIVGENVFGLVNWNGGLVFDEVQTDLEAEGYEVQPYVLPACAVNAPHRRDRVWFVAYRQVDRQSSSERTNGWKEHKQNDRNGIRPSFDTNGSCWPTSHPKGNGLNGSDCEHEVNPSQGGEYAQRNLGTGDNEWLRADNEETGVNSNTESKQSEWLRFEQREFSEQEQGQSGGSGSGLGDGPATNSRLQRQAFCQQQATRIKQCSSWSQFPTQSPICSRNDGLSSRLDGITFSKWRNESIKAAGNAIVPQVALQIFKAIQAYQK